MVAASRPGIRSSKDGRRFNPALRAIFVLIFAYPLFRAIRARANNLGANIGWSAGLMYISYFGSLIFASVLLAEAPASLTQHQPLHYIASVWLAGLISAAPLVIVQRSVNRLNEASRVESHYSPLNIATIIIVSIILLLAMAGSRADS